MTIRNSESENLELGRKFQCNIVINGPKVECEVWKFCHLLHTVICSFSPLWWNTSLFMSFLYILLWHMQPCPWMHTLADSYVKVCRWNQNISYFYKWFWLIWTRMASLPEAHADTSPPAPGSGNTLPQLTAPWQPACSWAKLHFRPASSWESNQSASHSGLLKSNLIGTEHGPITLSTI